jgi:hypothetical protein
MFKVQGTLESSDEDEYYPETAFSQNYRNVITMNQKRKNMVPIKQVVSNKE